MAVAAVPNYLGNDFGDCPPGHRFTLYGQFWQRLDWSKIKGDSEKNSLPVGSLSIPVQQLVRSVANRQTKLALANSAVSYHAQSTSPLVTGMGIEHPLENGMAFLNPYGVPYLAGSGVKGVIRQAARELRDKGEWTNEHIALLFGPDDAGSASRGALTFWDVVPSGEVELTAEIMNPHHRDYYEGKSAPHDSESPVPIYFLAVKAGSRFVFHVQCEESRLANTDLKDRWRRLLDCAVDYAFEWLGFGAKTAVGYGAMRVDPHVEAEAARRAEEESKRRAQQEEERIRRETEQAEAAREAAAQAEFDALPESRRMLIEAEKSIDALQQSSGQDPVLQHDAASQAKRLIEAAPSWADESHREEAATLLESYYDAVGWHQAGRKSRKQKNRQEKKKRDAIARIRSGG